MKSSKSLKRVFSAFLVLCMLMSNLLVPVGATELEMEQSITDVVVYSESGDGTGTGESGDGEGTGEGGDGTGTGESGDGEGTGEGGDGTGTGEGGDGTGTGEGGDGEGSGEGGDGTGFGDCGSGEGVDGGGDGEGGDGEGSGEGGDGTGTGEGGDGEGSGEGGDGTGSGEGGDGEGTGEGGDGEGGDGEGSGEGGDGTGSGEGGDGEGSGEGGDGEGTGEGGDGEGTGEGGENQQPSDDGEIIPFSCFTLDSQGRKLNPYWSAEECAWYLFVPSTQILADTVIYFTGSIVDITSGEVDKENSVVTGAFSENCDQVTLTMSDGTVHTVIVMQSKLPSVYITLNGVTLDKVHTDKNAKYKKNDVSIMDPSGQYNLTAEECVEFKGRGNSTWTFFDKKAYQIKFDEKTSVLGMGKAKKWVLLANAADESLMRNMLAFQLASELGMEGTPDAAYVDLWINGEYRGNYTIGEKVEIGSNRVDLKDDNGTVFEQDQGFYYEEDYWLYDEMTSKYFTAKETNADDEDTEVMQGILDRFQAVLDELMDYLYTTDPADVTLETLGTMIDVDSFAKFYLVNEFTCNTESTASSFYLYMDGLNDVLHGGPVWDFDSSMGNEKEEQLYYMENHVLFNRLLTCPVFYNRAVEIYNQNKDTFVEMASNLETLREEIGNSATMNYIRWNIWGEPNPKYTLNDYSSSYDEGCGKLTKWLNNRVESFAVRKLEIAFAHVNEDCTTMELYFAEDENFTSVIFAVWCDEGGQDDLKWYRAEKNAEGVWESQVDLSAHHSAGKYTIHVYGTLDGTQRRRAAAHTYVEKTNEAEFSAKLSENQLNIEAVMYNVGMYEDLAVRVWCQTDGDADLREYAVTEQAGAAKTCLIELRNHNEIGDYRVQFYGKTGDTWSLLDECTVTVTEKYWPSVAVEVSAARKELIVTVDNARNIVGLELFVWGEADGQDDATMYTAGKNADGTWGAVIDLDNHAENGIYQIEISGVMAGGMTCLMKETASVEGVVFSHETIAVYRLYNPITQEHLLTANELERDSLLMVGWLLDGIALKASQTGIPVYRLYNPYDDWHTYSTSMEEIAFLEVQGWTVDGIVFSSTEAVNAMPVYRLFNPYEQKNYHLLTASEEERDTLLALGWTLDGVALNAVWE